MYIELRDVTHVVHDGRPRRHRNNGEHGQHGQADVVEDDDAVVRSDPVLGAHVARRTAEAADERFPGQRARVDFAVLVQVEQPWNDPVRLLLLLLLFLFFCFLIPQVI